MALESPTLPELITRIIGDIDSRLPELLVRIPQNPANVFATAVAGLTYGAYGYIDKQVLQILPTTADEVGLSEWARVTQTPRKAATKAVVPVSMPITTLGTIISDGTTFRRDDGALFEVTEDPRSGVRVTSCVAIPVPHYPALRRALAFGLNEAERDAVHEFLGNEARALNRTIRRDAEIESGAYLDGMTVSDEDDAQASLF